MCRAGRYNPWSPEASSYRTAIARSSCSCIQDGEALLESHAGTLNIMSFPMVHRRSASPVGSADRRAAAGLTAGFTLVEVLVAFAILSMVLIGLFSGISTALR